MAPVACHGLNWLGSLYPARSPANACNSLFVSDLKTNIRIVPVAAASSLLMSSSINRGLAPAKLIALRRTTGRPGPFVLVAKDQATFFQIIRRHFDGYPIARKSLDPVLLHPAGGVGNKRVAVVELNAIPRVGQYLDHQTLELQKFFFRHVLIPSHTAHALQRPAHDAQERHCG